MKKKQKNQKPFVAKALLIMVLSLLTLGSIGITLAASRASKSLQTNILMRRSAQRILAEAVVPDYILNSIETCSYLPPKNPEYKGELMVDETTISTSRGGKFTTSVYIKNTGNTAWFGDNSGCGDVPTMRLGTARPLDRGSIFYNPGDSNWISPSRIKMLEPRVDPDQIATFMFSSTAPDVDDIFREYFEPVIEGKQWITDDDTTAEVNVYVGTVSEEMEKQASYLGKSAQASMIDLEHAPVIDVDISEQKLRLKFGEAVAREYIVSTGTNRTPTPLGTYKILNKQELRIGSKAPHYRMPMWQGWSRWGHGFHALPYLANDNGTFWEEALTHIGQRVSHGCIRLLPEDAEEFYGITEIGMKVVVHN